MRLIKFVKLNSRKCYILRIIKVFEDLITKMNDLNDFLARAISLLNARSQVKTDESEG